MTLHEIYKLNSIHNKLIHFVNTIKTEAFTQGAGRSSAKNYNTRLYDWRDNVELSGDPLAGRPTQTQG